MKTKQYAVLAGCGVAAAAFLVMTPVQSVARSGQAFKLEGAWVARVPGYPMMWTYSLAPDSSGRQASISGSIQVPITPAVYGLFTDMEYQSPMVGEVVMTGNDTATFTAVWYGLKKDFPFDQVVYIGVNSGIVKFTASGRAEMKHNLGFYHPTKDTDGDGLPDPGQDADLCIPATSIDTRVGLLPPCEASQL